MLHLFIFFGPQDNNYNVFTYFLVKEKFEVWVKLLEASLFIQNLRDFVRHLSICPPSLQGALMIPDSEVVVVESLSGRGHILPGKTNPSCVSCLRRYLTNIRSMQLHVRQNVHSIWFDALFRTEFVAPRGSSAINMAPTIQTQAQREEGHR